MSKEYRYQDADIPYSPINLRYGDDGVDYRSRPVEPSSNGLVYLATEHDVITAWADLAQNAVENLRPDAGAGVMKCWVGHNEQFGLVMLTLANMARYGKSAFKNEWSPFYESVLSRNNYETIFSGPTKKDDFYYCRIWYALMAHPDFIDVPEYESCTNELSQEFVKYRDTLLALSVSLECFQKRLSLKQPC